ncbi:hypothetical protein OAV88_00640 [bacterium]|nr:hypothetical protein [bacterium]
MTSHYSHNTHTHTKQQQQQQQQQQQHAAAYTTMKSLLPQHHN